MISFNSIPQNAAASGVYVEQENVNRNAGSPILTRRILVIGQFNTGKNPAVNKPQLIISRNDAWGRYGRGSMLAIMLEHALQYGKGSEVYALPIADGTVANTWTLEVAGTATAAGELAVYVEGKKLSMAVASADTAQSVATRIANAFTADLDLPITATASNGTVTVTSRWKGESGKQIDISANLGGESIPAGLSLSIVDNEDGAGDPPIAAALANSKEIWFTEIANPYNSVDNIAAMEAHGEVVNAPQVMKQFAGFVGYTDAITKFLSMLGGRNSQWTTFVPVPGSVTSAYRLAVMAATLFSASNGAEPGRPVKNLKLTNAKAGNADMSQQKDLIVRAGGSWTINNGDGTVTIGDLCTTRTTDDAGADTDDWRFTDIISNIQFKIYALGQKLLQEPFSRGVVLADEARVAPTYGVRPKTVKGMAIGLVDDWVARGLTTDRDNVVSGIVAEIDAANPGRINLQIPDTPSAGLRVLAAKLQWGFLV